MMIKFASITFITLFSLNASSLPEPYASTKLMEPNWHGWFPGENKKNLEIFIKKYKPKCVVELGSWMGVSTVFMAQLLEDNALLYAVDDWTADTDICIQANAEVRALLPTLYQQFLSNIIHAKLCEKIIPVRKKTLAAAKDLNVQADLIYVDASHDEESVYNDIINWYPKLNKNGIMCGDDWISFASVRKAVTRAALFLGITVSSDGNFWYFEPVKNK